MRGAGAILIAAMLAGCAGGTAPRPVGPPLTRVPAFSPTGLDAVMGKDATALVRLFGKPDAEVYEGNGRKLQFAGPICVLDTYLYPKGGTPVVTYLDARESDGSPIDRASCVAALARRSGGK